MKRASHSQNSVQPGHTLSRIFIIVFAVPLKISYTLRIVIRLGGLTRRLLLLFFIIITLFFVLLVAYINFS